MDYNEKVEYESDGEGDKVFLCVCEECGCGFMDLKLFYEHAIDKHKFEKFREKLDNYVANENSEKIVSDYVINIKEECSDDSLTDSSNSRCNSADEDNQIYTQSKFCEPQSGKKTSNIIEMLEASNKKILNDMPLINDVIQKVQSSKKKFASKVQNRTINGDSKIVDDFIDTAIDSSEPETITQRKKCHEDKNSVMQDQIEDAEESVINRRTVDVTKVTAVEESAAVEETQDMSIEKSLMEKRQRRNETETRESEIIEMNLNRILQIPNIPPIIDSFVDVTVNSSMESVGSLQKIRTRGQKRKITDNSNDAKIILNNTAKKSKVLPKSKLSRSESSGDCVPEKTAMLEQSPNKRKKVASIKEIIDENPLGIKKTESSKRPKEVNKKMDANKSQKIKENSREKDFIQMTEKYPKRRKQVAQCKELNNEGNLGVRKIRLTNNLVKGIKKQIEKQKVKVGATKGIKNTLQTNELTNESNVGVKKKKTKKDSGEESKKAGSNEKPNVKKKKTKRNNSPINTKEDINAEAEVIAASCASRDNFILTVEKSSINYPVVIMPNTDDTKGIPKASYDCHICGKFVTNRFSELYSHLKSHSVTQNWKSAQQKETCKICGNVLPLNDLLDHMSLHATHSRCSVCNEFVLEKDVRAHRAAHSEHFICGTCGELYTSLPALRKHLCHHSKGHVYPCDDCDQKFAGLEKLVRHVSSEHMSIDPAYAQCIYCFELTDNIKNHIYTAELCKFKCKLCRKVVSDKDEFIAHIEGHRDNQMTRTIDITPKVEYYDCADCGARLKEKHKLHDHTLCHQIHSMYEKSISRADRSSCSICQTLMPSSSLAHHMSLHESLERCHICHQFMDSLTLEKHLKNHLEDVLCDLCGERFPSEQKMTDHRWSHARLMNRPCAYCGLVFTGEVSRVRHHSLVHQGIDAAFIECPMCLELIGEHIDYHLMDPKYCLRRCRLCRTRFKHADEFRTHVQTHHGNCLE